MVLSVEFDAEGSLWIGYGSGLQCYDGRLYHVFADVARLKDPVVRDLQRWGEDLFVATGSSGIHRIRNGAWTWYRPFGESGLKCNSVSAMAVDAANDRLVVSSLTGGLWEVRDHTDPIRFSPVERTGNRYSLLNEVRTDPQGGCYAFNESLIVHHSTSEGFTEVLRADRISPTVHRINDCAAASDGTLWIATDDGLVGWRDGELVAHLERKDGLGVSSYVRTVFVDLSGRCWFSTPGFIGVYTGTAEIDTHLTFAPPSSPTPTALYTASPLPSSPLPTSQPTANETRGRSDGVAVNESGMQERGVIAFIQQFFNDSLGAILRIGEGITVMIRG
jgi:sugar lactone lactonase YvrE